jgi:hypothetical protein
MERFQKFKKQIKNWYLLILIIFLINDMLFVFKPRIRTTCCSIIVQKPPEKPPKQLWFNPIISPNRIKSASNHILDCLFQISLANWFRFLCLHSDHLTWKKNPSSTIQQWPNYWCFLFTKHGINLSCSYLFGFLVVLENPGGHAWRFTY